VQTQIIVHNIKEVENT